MIKLNHCGFACFCVCLAFLLFSGCSGSNHYSAEDAIEGLHLDNSYEEMNISYITVFQVIDENAHAALATCNGNNSLIVLVYDNTMTFYDNLYLDVNSTDMSFYRIGVYRYINRLDECKTVPVVDLGYQIDGEIILKMNEAVAEEVAY